jgi:hypothetical protein
MENLSSLMLPLQCFIVGLGGSLNVYYFKKVKNANALAASVIQIFIVLSGVLTLLNGWNGDLTFGLLSAYFVYDGLHCIFNYQSFLDVVFVIHHLVGIGAMHIIATSIQNIEIYTVMFITCIESSNFLRNYSDGWEVYWPRPYLHYSFPFCKLMGPFYATAEIFKIIPDEHYSSALVTALVFGMITLCDAHQTFGEFRESRKVKDNKAK